MGAAAEQMLARQGEGLEIGRQRLGFAEIRALIE